MTEERRPGRPRLYDEPRRRLNIELPDDLVVRLDKEAEHQGITRTRLMEDVLTDWLDAADQQPSKD